MNRDNASILKNEETRFAIKWEQFFFSPANSLPLTIIRILAGIEMMFLWWSWSPDLQQWFGPNGLISQDLLQQWRGGWAFSIFDRTTTESSLWAAYGAGFVAFFMLTAGVATTGAAVAAIGARSHRDGRNGAGAGQCVTRGRGQCLERSARR